MSDEHKGLGIGTQLLDALCDASKRNGIQRLHLLTTTADAYFKHFGFSVAERSQAPSSIANTKEFSEICPSSSVYMTLDL
ncbi:GNAT family N-acetyltransferase [Maribacter litopenaei]|uniref:GNAT family N-acetyltransferase n=1 Tax=Maribacter litopenaei TaxID=2976127 RepID=UPI003B849D2F